MTKYSRAQAVLHWAVFLLIVQQFVFHEAIVEAFGAFMKGQQFAFSPLIAAHVFGGILVGIFAVARLWLRKSRGVPEELPAPAAQRHQPRPARGPAGDPGPALVDRKSTRLNSSHSGESRMPSSA